MGACNSSAALEPADVTADGSAPVFWSPEREQEKRQAKLREIQLKQQAEIDRATGHLNKSSKQQQRRRSGTATSKSVPDEEKQQADNAASPVKGSEAVRPAQRSSRPVSMSLPSTSAGVMRQEQRVVVTDEELSEYPLPKSARRLARAASASASIASPTRSPEVSVSGGRRSDGELSTHTPRQQSTPMAARRSTTMPEAVKEEEQRQAEEEKECESSTPQTPTTTTPAITATPASVASSPVRVVTLRATPLREEKVQEVERPSAATASATFGVTLRKAPSVRAVDTAVIPTAPLVAAC